MTRSDASKNMGNKAVTTIRNISLKQRRCTIFSLSRQDHSAPVKAPEERGGQVQVHGNCHKLQSTLEVGQEERA